jgi:hypothetical protein
MGVKITCQFSLGKVLDVPPAIKQGKLVIAQ